jgi:hypothetical protein
MCGLVGNQSYANWQKVSTSLGCTEAAKNLECMRGKSIQDVQKAAKGLPSGFPPTFVPIPDGKVAFDDYYERGERGLFIKAVSKSNQRLTRNFFDNVIKAFHHWKQRP